MRSSNETATLCINIIYPSVCDVNTKKQVCVHKTNREVSCNPMKESRPLKKSETRLAGGKKSQGRARGSIFQQPLAVANWIFVLQVEEKMLRCGNFSSRFLSLHHAVFSRFAHAHQALKQKRHVRRRLTKDKERG